MDPTNPSFLRPIVYYEFLQGHSAREAANNICAAFNKDVVHHSTVSRWYHRFESRDISSEGQERPGPPSTLHDDDLRSALTSKPIITTRELATTLGCSKSTVSNRLASLGLRKILSTWVPHELRESDRACRVSIAESLLLRPHRKDLLNGMVTGDESWVRYVNDTRKRVWLPKSELPPKQSKRGLQQKKILICSWWNSKLGLEAVIPAIDSGMVYHIFVECSADVISCFSCRMSL
uniref:HTH_48 domain-containing protein n=1 Tax=Haemonchus contortus TaxID=6289 RepID=A0A7I5EDT2_HAECO